MNHSNLQLSVERSNSLAIIINYQNLKQDKVNSFIDGLFDSINNTSKNKYHLCIIINFESKLK